MMTVSHSAWTLLLLVTLTLLASPAAADYRGQAIDFTDSGTVSGDVVVTTGDSRYSGEVAPGGTYSVTFPVSVPTGASHIPNASVFLSWTWSHSGTSGTTPSLKTEIGGTSLEPARQYTDHKGSPPYDYPSGLNVYDVSGTVRAGTPLTLTVTNTATDAGIAFNGAALVFTYEDGTDAVSYWIAEGADMIYATEGITANETTVRIVYPDLPSVPAGGLATLLAVVPGGNKGKNTLTVNGREFAGLFNGKPYADFAVNSTEVGPLLVPGSNMITLRDEGDYMVPGVFVLVIRKSDGSSPGATTQGAPVDSSIAISALVVAACVALGTRRR